MAPEDDDDRNGLTRRRALQGMGAVLGTVAIGCGDDANPGLDGGGSSGDGSSGSGSGGTTIDVLDSTGPGGSGDGSTSADTTAGDESSTGEPVDECGSDSMGLSPEELLAEIDTIVVVMMENRSFDHYFGSATFREGLAVNGLRGNESNPRIDGTSVPVFHLQNLTPADPPHGWDDCHFQWNLGENNGFVVVHEQAHPASYDEVMGYHVRDQIPISYALADNYTLCDQWYCSVMGPTWPNRFYIHAATANGQQGNFPEPSITTIWDVCDDAGVSARNYYSDIAWIWGALVNPLTPFTDSLDEFFDAAAAGTLPQYVLIDPNFGLLPGGQGGNDDHPSHDITFGQILLGSIYQALATSPQWNRCLLVITYDEHGGFYDHISPGTMPDADPQFEQLGFRVPSIVIGPHVRRGCINSTHFDHVSVVSTATRRYGLASLNERVDITADLSSAINPEYLGNPQPPAPIPALSVSVSEMLSKRGSGQHELEEMIRRGDVPLPKDRRHANAGRDVALRLLDRAAKLGVVKLRP